MSSQCTLGDSTITSRMAEGSISRRASRKSSLVTSIFLRISAGMASTSRSSSGRTRRRALMPASLARAARSAPTKPCVTSASFSWSTSLARGMPRVWICRISRRDWRLGTPISISLSNLPGRRRAGSRESGLFVAPITTTLPRASIPSMRASSWATTRRSTSPVTSSLLGAMESISSMRMMEGACSSAVLNRLRSFSSDSP